ncbi:sensor histidine kinase [Flagellimonas meishanensis]|uniref:sensor histidine kinase n=1 Tax=Flagellimonas meishanensis TaxID=2873264 RepID=UPI001CA61248|nr:histidine kinase [[Muricauda] meishanensis]
MKSSTKYVVYHILFWVVIMFSFAISEWSYSDSLKDAIIFELLFLPSRLIAVYVNWFVLIPRILYRNKLLTYFATLILVLAVTAIAHRYFVLYWGYPKFFPHWMDGHITDVFNLPRLLQNALIIVSPVAFTAGFKLFSDWFNQRKETELLREEKKNAELKFLKSQINPHFLFNTLNSIYGLALEKSDKTPNLILKLSDILSYTLYESAMNKVSLTKEIELIKDIIALQEERFGKRMDISFSVEGETENLQIPPLILIPLVENAFKHGIHNEVKKGWIDIKLIAGTDSLMFKIANSVPSVREDGNSEGLGLKNISRRLELLFEDRHTLEIKSEDKTFSVVMEITFNTKDQ